MKYCQATIATTSEFSDTLSVLMIDYGSDGVTVTDYEDIQRVLREHTWDYADESLLCRKDPTVYVSGYYPETYDFAALAEHLNVLRQMPDVHTGTLELSIRQIDSADYENEWRKYYAPIELSTVAVVPDWIPYAGNKTPVYIDPGMAFGTGSHETTKLCLRLLETLDLGGKRCADIGCGSGILGAAALILGAGYCFMADIDEQAVSAAEQNCARNGVRNRAEIRKGSLTAENGVFDVLLANITADVLIGLEKTFSAALCENGTLIMSGIIHSRAKDVVRAYANDFELARDETDGEWRGMLWRKQAGVTA